MKEKRKTEITVKKFFDGELEAAEVFMKLIAQRANSMQKPIANHHGVTYNKVEHQNSHLPSGLCR